MTSAWLGGLLLLGSLLLPATAPAQDVLVALSSHLRAYEEAYQSFQQRLRVDTRPWAGPKQVESHRVTSVSLEGGFSNEEFVAAVRSRRPDLIVAIGSPAFLALKDITDTPLLYLLVPNAGPAASRRGNATGVTLEIPPEMSLKGLLGVAPSTRRIAVIHDPTRTGALLADALRAASRLGVTLVVREARSASAVASTLDAFPSNVDALWMLPDLSVTSPESLEAMLLFSLRRRVPILTFADKYLEMGATVAVTFDAAGIGEQAAKIAQRILSGEPPGQIPSTPPERVHVRVNPAVAAKLGLSAGPLR